MGGDRGGGQRGGIKAKDKKERSNVSKSLEIPGEACYSKRYSLTNIEGPRAP